MKIVTADIKTKCVMCRKTKTAQRYEMTYSGITVQLPICEACQQLQSFRLQDMITPLLDSVNRCAKYAYMVEAYEKDIIKMHAEEVKKELHEFIDENYS